jgi:PPOX class probable F420-dependent enzyme
MAISVSNVRDVADGTQAGQFEVGDRSQVRALTDLDPNYQHLLDEPITAVIAVMGRNGRPNLTPVWFDHEGDKVLLNLASHRKKVEWLRGNPQATFMLMNPANPYHWMSIKGTVSREVHEDDPDEGPRVTEQIDRMWAKYIQQPGGYALRDPERDERRILFEFTVDSIATFGKP